MSVRGRWIARPRAGARRPRRSLGPQRPIPARTGLPGTGCVPNVRGRSSSARHRLCDLVLLHPQRHGAARSSRVSPVLAALHAAPVAATAQRQREPGPGDGPGAIFTPCLGLRIAPRMDGAVLVSTIAQPAVRPIAPYPPVASSRYAFRIARARRRRRLIRECIQPSESRIRPPPAPDPRSPPRSPGATVPGPRRPAQTAGLRPCPPTPPRIRGRDAGPHVIDPCDLPHQYQPAVRRKRPAIRDANLHGRIVPLNLQDQRTADAEPRERRLSGRRQFGERQPVPLDPAVHQRAADPERRNRAVGGIGVRPGVQAPAQRPGIACRLPPDLERRRLEETWLRSAPAPGRAVAPARTEEAPGPYRVPVRQSRHGSAGPTVDRSHVRWCARPPVRSGPFGHPRSMAPRDRPHPA